MVISKWLLHFLQLLSKLVRHLLVIFLIGLRPLLGPACCKFTVSCTDFAVLKLQEGPLLHALWEIIKRLSRCQPLYRAFSKHETPKNNSCSKKHQNFL